MPHHEDYRPHDEHYGFPLEQFHAEELAETDMDEFDQYLNTQKISAAKKAAEQNSDNVCKVKDEDAEIDLNHPDMSFVHAITKEYKC